MLGVFLGVVNAVTSILFCRGTRYTIRSNLAALIHSLLSVLRYSIQNIIIIIISSSSSSIFSRTFRTLDFDLEKRY